MSSARAAAYRWPMVPQNTASAAGLVASRGWATRGGDGSMAAAPTPGAWPTACQARHEKVHRLAIRLICGGMQIQLGCAYL
jgi:hypothetical protein